MCCIVALAASCNGRAGVGCLQDAGTAGAIVVLEGAENLIQITNEMVRPRAMVVCCYGCGTSSHTRRAARSPQSQSRVAIQQVRSLLYHISRYPGIVLLLATVAYVAMESPTRSRQGRSLTRSLSLAVQRPTPLPVGRRRLVCLSNLEVLGAVRATHEGPATQGVSRVLWKAERKAAS